MQHKEQFNKPLKRKDFREAIDGIEKDIQNGDSGVVKEEEEEKEEKQEVITVRFVRFVCLNCFISPFHIKCTDTLSDLNLAPFCV